MSSMPPMSSQNESKSRTIRCPNTDRRMIIPVLRGWRYDRPRPITLPSCIPRKLVPTMPTFVSVNSATIASRCVFVKRASTETLKTNSKRCDRSSFRRLMWLSARLSAFDHVYPLIISMRCTFGSLSSLSQARVAPLSCSPSVTTIMQGRNARRALTCLRTAPLL